MTKPRAAVTDPSIRVGIEMPASLYQRLRAHADATGTTLSRLCRDGALLELERRLLVPAEILS